MPVWLQESALYRNWEGASKARERIVEQFEAIFDIENNLVGACHV
jgi:hypothetical protein